jgi:hypothetical protein
VSPAALQESQAARRAKVLYERRIRERVETQAENERHFVTVVPVRAQGKNSVTHIVAGQSFAKHYGLDTSVARRYPVAMEDDILVLDLRGDSVDVTGPRAKKPNADGSGEGDE